MRTIHTALTPGSAKKGLTGSTLKIIAIICMLIDHSAMVLLEKGYFASTLAALPPSSDPKEIYTIFLALPHGKELIIFYFACRLVGRIAFPIFCFLLAEGFTYTRDPKRYLLSLGLFALISEVPFDLASKGVFLEFTYQNVFFTLFLGACTLYAYEYIEEKGWSRYVNILPITLFMAIAHFAHTDYGIYGVGFILCMYVLRGDRVKQTFIGFLLGLAQITASLAFAPIFYYNGKRGLSLKWFFYIFYPAHLLILKGIQVLWLG